MRVHLDDATLERALDGELDREARARVERHLAECAECADRLAVAGREERRLLGLLQALDHEPPPLDWAAVRSSRPRSEAARHPGGFLIAASLAFLLVGAAVLAAIPGTPVRKWVESALRDEPPSGGPARSRGEAPRSGIAVVPADPFEVAFTAPQPRGSLRVSFGDGAEVELTVIGDPVELETGADRLIVANAGSNAGYELRVPRTLETFRLTIAGRRVLERRGGTIRGFAARDAAGAYVVDLSAEVVEGS